MPVRFDENSLIWVAADEPIKHNGFLSPKILELCGDLPIFWLRPTYPKGKNPPIFKICRPSLHLNAFPNQGNTIPGQELGWGPPSSRFGTIPCLISQPATPEDVRGVQGQYALAW